jgi:hypothetical protein
MNVAPTISPSAIDRPAAVPDVALGDPLDAVDHGKHAQERQGGAGQVEATGRGIAVLGQQPRTNRQQQGHERDRDQEDRSPPEALEQDAAGQWPDRRAGRVARHPQADRHGALARIAEHVADQR